MQLFYTYLLSLPILFILDMFWVGFFAKDYYARLMSQAVEIKFYWPAIIAFYLLYVIGIFIFAVYPGIVEKSLYKTLILAGLFGFFCYMTYDLTNLGTIKNWPTQMLFVDVVWGTVLTALVAISAYKIYFWIG